MPWEARLPAASAVELSATDASSTSAATGLQHLSLKLAAVARDAIGAVHRYFT
jgi:hypothetical protein